MPLSQPARLSQALLPPTAYSSSSSTINLPHPQLLAITWSEYVAPAGNVFQVWLILHSNAMPRSHTSVQLYLANVRPLWPDQTFYLSSGHEPIDWVSSSSTADKVLRYAFFGAISCYHWGACRNFRYPLPLAGYAGGESGNLVTKQHKEDTCSSPFSLFALNRRHNLRRRRDKYFVHELSTTPELAID